MALPIFMSWLLDDPSAAPPVCTTFLAVTLDWPPLDALPISRFWVFLEPNAAPPVWITLLTLTFDLLLPVALPIFSV